MDKKVSFAKKLFTGVFDEKNLMPFPEDVEKTSEVLPLVLDSVDKFMADHKEDYLKFDHKGAQTKKYIEALKSLGMFGLIIPEEHGGMELSNRAYARVIEQITTRDGSTALTVGAHSSIGMKGLLLFGTDDQKQKYLPKLASGKMIAAFCLTESTAGSDAASIKTKAQKLEDGSWKLNGEKIWITNGPIADFFTVFAVTDAENSKLTAFIVERGEGVITGEKEDKMGIRASATSTVTLEDVIVPAENVLGEEGKGFKVAMSILNNGRTGLGGGCIGALKRSYKEASAYAKERKQFGKPIAEYELIKAKLARIKEDIYATESVVSMVGHLIDEEHEDYSMEAAISKVFASEALWNGANEALQIAGGNGFMKDYPYEMIVRDSRINMIFEGTNEILRLFVALNGVKEVGEFLEQTMGDAKKTFKDPIAGVQAVSSFIWKKVASTSVLFNQSVSVKNPKLSPYARVLKKDINKLFSMSEYVARSYGKKVTQKQLILKRIADAAIYVYVGSCVLARTDKDLSSTELSQKDKDLAMELCASFLKRVSREVKQNSSQILNDYDFHIKKIMDLSE